MRPPVASFLREKLMAARNLLRFSTFRGRRPIQWRLNVRAPLRGHARPLVKTDRTRRNRAPKQQNFVFLSLFCRLLSALANGRTCPRVKPWKCRFSLFRQWARRIEKALANPRDH